MKEDLIGSLNCGIQLKQDCDKRKVQLSTLNYVKHTRRKFQHLKTTRKQHASHPLITKVYDRQTQLINEPHQSHILLKYDTIRMQQIVGVFLYYARGIDNTILLALKSINTMQSKPTQDIHHKVNHPLDFFAIHPKYIVYIKCQT